MMAKRGMLGYWNKMIINTNIDEDMKIWHNPPSLLGCEWSGTIKDCIEKELGHRGYEGYEYYCPRCKRILKQDRHIFYD